MSILHALLIWLLITLCKLISLEALKLYKRTKNVNLKETEKDSSS